MPKKSENIFFDYHQPDFYRFSEDSILLAKKIADLVLPNLMDKLKDARGLDLCAGSGVVGIEIMATAHRSGLGSPVLFDFCELQEDFRPSLQENLKNYSLWAGIPSYRPNLFFRSFEELGVQESYDLIVSNPPYYDPKNFRMSPLNSRKNTCHYFIQGTRSTFLQTIHQCLKPGGEAYFIHRPREGKRDKILGEARMEIWDEENGAIIYRYLK